MNNHSLPDHLTLGIEFGSTRIKAVLIGPDHHPLFSGSHSWENQLVNGYWSYSMDAVWAGMQDAYGQIAAQVKTVYGEVLTHIDAMGISAMMHGYLPFDCEAHQLTPFRTWRNTTTAQAAAALTDLFQFNIPSVGVLLIYTRQSSMGKRM